MMPSPESASGQTRRRSSQGEVDVCCIDRTNAVQCHLIIISGASLGCGLWLPRAWQHVCLCGGASGYAPL